MLIKLNCLIADRPERLLWVNWRPKTRHDFLNMELLGTIEPAAGEAMRRDGWIALIGSHPFLAPVQPRHGINPFTKLPDIYQAATDSAIVLLDDAKKGAIHWAMDDSHRLVVWSLPMARARVVAVAEDVASRLGGRFHAGHDD